MRIHHLLILLIWFSCSKNTDPIIEPDANRSYYYQSFDSDNNLVVTGWLKIEFNNEDEISGTWNFQKIGNPENIGPQTGEGDLVGGRINQDSIWIELNPQFIDNNLQLIGKYTPNQFKGKWLWISLVGITNQGYFEAISK